MNPRETAERRLDELEARILRLEEALAHSLEPGSTGPALSPRPPPSSREDLAAADGDEDSDDAEALADLVPKAAAVLPVLSALGTSFLVLGGAFLVRTITDTGVVPRTAGIAAGFAYALGVMAAADRLARSGRRVLASFLLVTAIVIGNPLVFEAVMRFRAIGTATAAAALTILTGACLAVARRRDLPAIAWAASLAAAATAAALAIATAMVGPFAAALLSIGVAVDWIPGRPGWRSVRWPAAAAADGMVLWMALASLTAAAGEPAPLFPLVVIALPVLYLAGIFARMLATNRDADAFDVLQGFAATAIGMGALLAAVRARGAGGSADVLGVAVLVCGVALYSVALGPLARAGRSRRSSAFAAALALAFSLFGGACLFTGSRLAWLWLFLAAAAVGASSWRARLRLHAPAFLVASAWPSGLVGAAFASLVSGSVVSAGAFSFAAIASIVLAGASLATSARRWPTPDAVGRVARLGLAAVAAFGGAGLGVALLAPLAAGTGRLDAGAIALVRSAVLAAAAVLLAFASRRTGFSELGGFAYALLVLGGVKLLFEDIPAGRPLTLFAAFALYGVALLSIPKLLRSRSL